MRIAFLGDIHSNIEALRSVFEEIQSRKVDEIACTGDIIGYCASPSECIEALVAVSPRIVAGNHDYAAVGKTDFSRFNPLAKAAIEWTSTRLSFGERAFLASLPVELSFESFKIVHSSPLSPESWHYIRKLTNIYAQFEAFGQRVCFIGHSHKPGLWKTTGFEPAYAEGAGNVIFLSDRCIVDIGSVGQPRDGDSRSGYVLFDTELFSVEFCRVKYDFSITAERILTAGLPEKLASRLFEGK